MSAASARQASVNRYSVKELSRLSGVSVRTLHHYDAIGLLPPAGKGANGYRYYEEPELLRLQQILFHRVLGVPLREIAALLDRPDFDRVAALHRHRQRLAAALERHRQLIATIDHTIAQLQGDRPMSHAELYEGFSSEKQAEYERWLRERYGAGIEPAIERSRRKWSTLSEEDRKQQMCELEEIEEALAAGFRAGLAPDAAALEPALEHHRAWVACMWDRECSPQAYAGLADLYGSHADFQARFETLASGFCVWLIEAMKAHAQRRGAAGHA